MYYIIYIYIYIYIYHISYKYDCIDMMIHLLYYIIILWYCCRLWLCILRDVPLGIWWTVSARNRSRRLGKCGDIATSIGMWPFGIENHWKPSQDIPRWPYFGWLRLEYSSRCLTMFPRPSSVSISMCYFQGVALELSWGNSPEPPVMNPWFHACFPFFSLLLKPHGGFLKWGFPKWMVYNGQSYLNGWFGGTPIVHTGPERPGWSWACSGLAPYSLPSVQVGVDWGVLQITWSDTYSICCELTWIDREFLEDRHKIVDVPLSAWLPIQDVTAVIFWFMSNCWPLLKCLRHFQHAPAVDLDGGRSRLQCHHASRWDGSVTLSKHNPKFG